MVHTKAHADKGDTQNIFEGCETQALLFVAVAAALVVVMPYLARECFVAHA